MGRIAKEIRTLKNSNCEYIIKYKEDFYENSRIYIVTEYYKVRMNSNFGLINAIYKINPFKGRRFGSANKRIQE